MYTWIHYLNYTGILCGIHWLNYRSVHWSMYTVYMLNTLVELYTSCMPCPILIQNNKTTAPRIPAWSPTVVLTRRHFDSLRRSDGMRCFQSPMAVDTLGQAQTSKGRSLYAHIVFSECLLGSHSKNENTQVETANESMDFIICIDPSDKASALASAFLLYVSTESS